MRIRKQVCDLTVEDLNRYPVWEYALDEEGEEGQDEATVRPLEINGPVNGARDCIVLASFTLADGSRFTGYLTPTAPEANDLWAVKPVIVTEGGQVGFWYGALKPKQVDLVQSYARLGKSADAVFPVTYQSAIPLEDGLVCGIIPGFFYLESWDGNDVGVIR